MIIAINRDTDEAMLEEGSIHPITNWFDQDGEECDPEFALTAVCGEEGNWYVITLAEFGETKH